MRFPTLLLLCLLALAGCGLNVGVSVRTFGAATIDDLKAEEAYKGTYASRASQLHQDMQPYIPSGTNPGVCNKGGQAADCIAADTRSIADIRAWIAALEAIQVPPRFVEPDRLLRAALAEQVKGLELRVEALRKADNALWDEQAEVLEKAVTALQQAYLAFPEDNRPFPAP